MIGGNLLDETIKTLTGATMAADTHKQLERQNYLCGARVYLSGPMGFVASRTDEKKFGWRGRVSDFLNTLDVTIFDPWLKPTVRGLNNYGIEDINIEKIRKTWSFEQNQAGDEARAECAELFSPTLNVDLRMVDTSDFVIAYCPTNIYSVGTVHEIIRSRHQSKPVLFVSPSIDFPALEDLREHLKDDKKGSELLDKLIVEAPIKRNLEAIPSPWYMPLIDNATFFDGFGFASYFERFNWAKGSLDAQEERCPPKNPLLAYLEKLTERIPDRWDNKLKKRVTNDDWLLWDCDHYSNQKKHAAIIDGRGVKQE